VYAIAGMELMHDLPQLEDGGITRNINFQSFGHSLITVFRLATVDDWTSVMYASRVKSRWLDVYYLTIVFISDVCLVNLFVAVIMQQFSLYSGAHHDSKFKPDLFKKILHQWQIAVPSGAHWLPVNQLVTFLQAVGPPLGFAKTASTSYIIKRLRMMHIPVYPDQSNGVGQVRYQHVLQGIIRHGLDVDLGMLKVFIKDTIQPVMNAEEFFAAQIIWNAWRRYKKQGKISTISN